MSPALKAFLLQLFVLSLVLLCIPPVVRVMAYFVDFGAMPEPEEAAFMGAAGLLLLLLVFALQRVTTPWINELTGHVEPPKKEPSPQVQFVLKLLLAIMLTSMLAYAWYSIVPPRTTPFNAFFSAVATGLGATILVIALFYDEFGRRYVGLALGLSLSSALFGSPSQLDFPGGLLLLVLLVPPVLGHAICIWWNKQDFVVAARRDRKLEAERKRAQQEADRVSALQKADELARDAELKMRMETLCNAPPPRQSARPNLGPEAQKLKDDIDQLYKR